MLEKRREYCLGSGEIHLFRMWNAFSFVCTQGLTGMAPPPATVSEFLAVNRFDKARDDESTGTGFSPLVFAALSGNAPVVCELIERHSVDVNARIRIDMGDFGIEKGMCALGIAAGFCPQAQVCNIISSLLKAGADPNSRFRSGGTPLMAAVVGQNEEAVRSLLVSGNLNLEIGLRMNNATAVNLAGIMGTYATLQALLDAGADREHR